MTEVKHTPGPWSADDYAIEDRFHGSGRYVRAAERHWAICRVDATGGCSDPRLDVSEDEAKANARLIAAAPDMLEALKVAMPSVGGCDGSYEDCDHCAVIRTVRAAIRKATGAQ